MSEPTPTRVQMKERLAGLLHKSQTHRLSYSDIESRLRLDVPTFGDVPHTAGPKAVIKSLSEDAKELAESGLGFDATKREFYLLPLGLNDGYRADHGDKLHLVVTQRVEDMLVRIFDKSKPSKGVGEKVWQGQGFDLEEATHLAVEFANSYLESSGVRIPSELPNWQFYHDIGTELGVTPSP